jgi:hypothetical protein
VLPFNKQLGGDGDLIHDLGDLRLVELMVPE